MGDEKKNSGSFFKLISKNKNQKFHQSGYRIRLRHKGSDNPPKNPNTYCFYRLLLCRRPLLLSLFKGLNHFGYFENRQELSNLFCCRNVCFDRNPLSSSSSPAILYEKRGGEIEAILP